LRRGEAAGARTQLTRARTHLTHARTHLTHAIALTEPGYCTMRRRRRFSSLSARTICHSTPHTHTYIYIIYRCIYRHGHVLFTDSLMCEKIQHQKNLWKKVISERFKVGKVGKFWGLFFHLQTFRFFPPPFGHSSHRLLVLQ
jgi:hypothetical protein